MDKREPAAGDKPPASDDTEEFDAVTEDEIDPEGFGIWSDGLFQRWYVR